MADPVLATQGLEVGIAGHLIARCDDLELATGEVLVLIGKNGAGKSTYLRTLGGLLKPMSGQVLFGGRPQAEVKLEKEAAWLSQEEHLEFAWSVTEYVSLGRLAHHSGLSLSAEDRQKVAEALAMVDAEDLADRTVLELSGGERQRVRVARALAQDTPLILMDEPTTHLDLEHQLAFLGLLEKLKREGKSIVVSLHDVFHAGQIGSRFLLFQNGVASHASSLTKEKLEATLSVGFEPTESGYLVPIVRRTTDYVG